MLILPCKCNQSLIWKEGKKCNKVVIPDQPLQEIVAHLEHLRAPTADLAFATKGGSDLPWQKLQWVQKAAGSATSGGRELPIIKL